MANKQSIQLAEYIKPEPATLGANKTPANIIHYTWINGAKTKVSSVTYILGTLDEASKDVLKSLKAGDRFVVVKEEVPNPKDPARPYWNLKEFKTADTYVEKPAYIPGAGKYKKPYEKKEFDTTGIKVGAARNQAIAFLAATKGTAFTLDDVDTIAYEIIKRQQIQEDNVRNNTTPADVEENNANTQYQQDQDEAEEIPF